MSLHRRQIPNDPRGKLAGFPSTLAVLVEPLSSTVPEQLRTIALLWAISLTFAVE
jgi:hypothetical protein